MPFELNSINVSEIKSEAAKSLAVQLFVARLDQIHPYISGNKFFKLHYNMLQARKKKKGTLLTFGGAFSNHIVATAAAGEEFGFKTIGYIRGEKHLPLNPRLQFAEDCGMQFRFLHRNMYEFIQIFTDYEVLKKQYPDAHIIPSGGANSLGIQGCMEILNYIETDFDYICCACGTGTTLAGIILSLPKGKKALGFQVLKGKNYLSKEVENWLKVFNSGTTESNWSINEDYHFGGYAKRNKVLDDFIDSFKKEQNVALDFVYTGKMFYGIFDLISKGYFPRGARVLALHTGGVFRLQGRTGSAAASAV